MPLLDPGGDRADTGEELARWSAQTSGPGLPYRIRTAWSHIRISLGNPPAAVKLEFDFKQPWFETVSHLLAKYYRDASALQKPHFRGGDGEGLAAHLDGLLRAPPGGRMYLLDGSPGLANDVSRQAGEAAFRAPKKREEERGPEAAEPFPAGFSSASE